MAAVRLTAADAQSVRFDVPVPATRRVETATVIDTTEIRWFGDGELPRELTAWFTRNGSVGAIERRCDTYRLDGRTDVGFKLRSRQTPELKIRQSTAGALRLGEGCDGHVEVWHKWSPAPEPVDRTDGDQWVDVHKVITKRRVSERGVEMPPGPVPSDPPWVGVDVETVELTAGASVAWSFAFAAFGPPGRRLSAIATCWEHLLRTPPPDPSPTFATRRSCGYPEYLTRLHFLHGQSGTSRPDRYDHV